jgi:Fe-S oxidoreductase
LNWDEDVADIMYTTLNDGLLQEWCVGNYDHEELVLDARARLFEMGLAPESVSKYASDYRNHPFEGKSPSTILSEFGVKTTDDAELVLYSGRSVREDHASILGVTGRLFNLVNVPFQVLTEEPVSGWPLYQLGDIAGARECSVRLAKNLKACGATKVVVLDADAYRMLLTRTTRFGGDLSGITVRPVIDLLADWMDRGWLKVITKIAEPVTYHDPCVMARYCEDTETPRKLLNAVIDGELREMETHKKRANCCGEGGLLRVHRPDIADQVGVLRLDEAAATGASILATACPRCDTALNRAKTSAPKHQKIEIRNLICLVAEAAGLDRQLSPSRG